MLYIVSTPIGNLKDISQRAIDVLTNVHLIACEDTRHTRILLKEYGITTPLTSYFEHNKFQKAKIILERLKNGEDVALVSDAGTPGINDPGYRLVGAAIEEGMEITVIPGASAVIAALSLSGMPTDSFCFEGFFPVKSAARCKKIESLKDEKRTVVFYESVHRLLKTLEDIQVVLEDPYIVVVREITKKFEEVKRGRCSEILKYYQAHKPKGEFVVLWNLKLSGKL